MWVWTTLVVLVAPTVTLAQADKAPPVPELRPGTGSPPAPPTDDMMRLGRAIMGMRGDSLSESGAVALDSAIVLNPKDVDARFLRASCTFCGWRHGDLASASADIDSALAHFGTSATPLGTSLQDAYGLKAHVELARGNDQVALAMIEKAIRLKPDAAENLFNPGTTDPDSATIVCNWHKTTLNGLVARNPSDYRAYLARGLYYGFFKQFTTTTHAKAMQDLLTARRLAPSSALCAYFLGCEYMSGGKGDLARLFEGGPSVAAQESALREFAAAIALDPHFAPAFAQRAELSFSQKQYALAIKDYDAVIVLEPENAGALNDRGLAKKYLENYSGAAWDLAESAKLKTSDPNKAADDVTISSTYESLAECYAALGEFEEAADNMTEAVRCLVAPFTQMLSLSRLRDLFPECSYMDDDEFLHTLHRALRSTMTYETFEGVRKDNISMESTVVPDAYVKRGDYLLRAGHLTRALADYARARRAFPKSAGWTDRWRLATDNDSQSFFVDGQAEPPAEGAHLQVMWVKTLERKKASRGWDIERISVDCGAKTLQVESSATYGPDGTMIASHEVASPPSAIVPDSIGEWFAKALCR